MGALADDHAFRHSLFNCIRDSLGITLDRHFPVIFGLANGVRDAFPHHHGALQEPLDGSYTHCLAQHISLSDSFSQYLVLSVLFKLLHPHPLRNAVALANQQSHSHPLPLAHPLARKDPIEVTNEGLE